MSHHVPLWDNAILVWGSVMSSFVHRHHIDVSTHVVPDDSRVDCCPAYTGLLQRKGNMKRCFIYVQKNMKNVYHFSFKKKDLHQSIFLCQSLWICVGSPLNSFWGSKAYKENNFTWVMTSFYIGLNVGTLWKESDMQPDTAGSHLGQCFVGLWYGHSCATVVSHVMALTVGKK